MRSLAAISLLSMMLLVTGCATIMRGPDQDIPVITDPAGARVSVSGQNYTTPATLKLKRKFDYIVQFSKEGYESNSVLITKSTSMLFTFLDIIFVYVGLLIDTSNGAIYNLEPSSVTISLFKISAVPGPDEVEISIGEDRPGELEITSSVPEVDIRFIPVR